MSNKYSSGRTSWPKYYALLLVAFLFSQGVWSQISAYSYTPLTGLTYTPFTLATAGPTGDDAGTTVTLPFTFTYNATAYTAVRLNTNGWISFNSASTSNSLTPSELFNTSGPNSCVAGWLGDGNANGANGGLISSGVHPTLTDVYVFQWTDVSGANGGGASATLKLSFQIWLYGPSSSNPGRVEILYGPTLGAINTGRSLGIENNIGGTGNYKNALNGLSNSTATATAWPGNGNGYRFDPPVLCQNVSLVGGTTTSSVTTACSGVNFTLNVTGGTSGATGITYQWYDDVDGDLTFTAIPSATGASLTTNTTVTNSYRREEICLANTTSAFSTPITITVAGAQAVPYVEGFEGMPAYGAGIAPNCGSMQAITTPALTSANTSVRNGVGARTGTGYFWSRYSSDGVYYTPAISLTSGESYDFAYWLRETDGLTGFTVTALVGTAANYLTMTSLGTAANTSSTTYVESRHTYVAPATGTYYFAIRSTETSGNPWYQVFDDVSVTETPACAAPTALTASAITATGANLGWTENGTATLWNIEYGPAGFTLGTGIPVGGVNSNPYAISGLTAFTTYNYYVQADCGGSTSDWSGPFSFTTAPGCGSAFTDPGGAGNYANGTTYEVTICPDVPGEVVTVAFTSFATEGGWDGLMIYNGPSTASPLIASTFVAGSGAATAPTGSWNGTNSPGTVISTDVSGCLTFRFTSDGTGNAAGWESTVSCGVPPTCGTPGVSGVVPSFNAVSFTINASAIGTPAGYEYEIVLDGATPTGVGVASATNTVTSATTLSPVTAYDLYVRTDCGMVDGFSDWAGPISFTTNPAPPANDDCANAIAISCAMTPVLGTTLNATVDANYVPFGPDLGTNATERGVWYTIVGDDQSYTISTCDPEGTIGYDTRLTVFTGTCGALSPIVANDDITCTPLFRSEVTFNAFVGTTYYLFVHGYQFGTALSNTGDFELNISCAPACIPAANDACASAEVLAQNASCVNITGTTLCAGPTPGIANPAGVTIFQTFNDVWYQFTATTNDYYLTFSNLVASGLIYTIYVGDDCSTLAATGINGFDVVSGFQQGLFGATVGETYWLRVGVDPNATTPVDGSFDLCLVALPCSTPASATVTATSNTNVNVVINGGIEGEAYIIEYGPAGHVAGTAGTAGAGGTIVNTTTLTNNIAVAANSNYTFYVRKDCSGTAEGYSFNVGPYNVSTYTIVPTSGTNTITTCDATIYDAGTTGNFPTSINGTLTVYPATAGSVLALNGTWQGGENCCDYLRFYQGVGTGGTLLAEYFGTALQTVAVQSTTPDQPITIQFISDVSVVGPGFAVTASCLEACSGIPAVGVLNGPATACSGVNFTMNVANPSLGYVYQWQRVTSAGWTNIPGANSASYTTSQTSATTYRCRVTCTYPGGYLGISAPKTVGMSAPADCYCTPGASDNTGGDHIESVELAGINNVSGANASSYTLYPATPGLTTSLGAGGEYVAEIVCGDWTSSNYLAAWIDFNRNGIFEVSEKIGNSGSLGAFGVATFNFTVPSNASLGTSRLRVREIFGGAGVNADACATPGFGETEDYVVTLVAGAANDARANATAVAPPQFPGCSSFNVNLANATPSQGAGNDVWYSFFAASNAVRIAVTGTQNVEIEVEDSMGASVPTASATSTANASNTGSEIYITGGLTPGMQYWVAVRDMSGTPGTASVCIQTLNDSRCDNGPNFASLCQAFKADWTGTSSYNFVFTNTLTSSVHTASSTNSTQILLSSVAGLQYGQSYNVGVSSVFNLVDAAGAPVQVIANSNETCTITIAPQPAVNLRAADRDPVTRAIGAFISTDISVCAVQSWDWSFELVDNLGMPADLLGAQIVNTGSSSRYFRTSNIPGVFGGARYRVRIRPVFASGPGTFDDASFFYLRIAGVAPGMVVADEETTPSELYMERNTENGVSAAIYPNPSNGELVNLNLAGIDSENVNIRIMDATGRVVWTNRYVVEGALNTVIAFDRPLTSGLYMVEMTFGNEVITERMMVTK
jgi:hypothetical protein